MGCVGGAQKKQGLKGSKEAAAPQPQNNTTHKNGKDASAHREQEPKISSVVQPQRNTQPHQQPALNKANQQSHLHEQIHENPPAEVHPGHHSFLSEKQDYPAKPASIIKEMDSRLSHALEKQAIAERKSGVQSRGMSQIRSSIKNQLRSGLESIHEQDQTVRDEGQHNFSIPTKGLNLHVEIN